MTMKSEPWAGCGMDDKTRNPSKIRYGDSGPLRAGRQIVGHSSSMIQRAGSSHANSREQFSNSV